MNISISCLKGAKRFFFAPFHLCIVFFIFSFFVCSSLFSIGKITENTENWKITKTRNFKANNLYGYIDGGAEVFLELGFKELTVENYSNGKDEITIEKYLMDSPESALAIYLLKCGKEKPTTQIKYRNNADKYQIQICKGDYYILVDNFKGKAQIQKDMITLGNSSLEKIKDTKPTNLFSVLPKTGLIKGSQFIFRGPYSMQSICTLGAGDVLMQKEKIFGVTGDYKDTKGKIFTRLIIKYPDKNSAGLSFSNFINHLDPTKKILEKSSNKFTFKDHAGKFGSAELSNNVLEIKVNLFEKP
jgi:hypothetical protein